jgi:hypothetical protein
VNQINMELDSTAIRAAMESKTHQAAMWNEIERMQAESMIPQVSKKLKYREVSLQSTRRKCRRLPLSS